MGIFGGIFGGHPKTTVAVAAGMTFQTSAQGLPIPLVFGTTKIAPNLIWYDDFTATAQASQGSGGGKGGVTGGGGGKNGGGTAGYTYTAAFQMGLCDGPIIGVGDVYANKQITSLSSLGYTLFLGDYTQTAWGYLTTNHPTKALNYRGLAHIDNPSFAMGSSPQIPNHNVEVKARYSNSVAQEVFGEKWPIPVTPFQVTVKFSAQWTADVSVMDDNGTVYTKVGSSPASGQYTAAAGVYTFNSANSGTNVYINYNASAGPDADASLVVNFLLTDARSGAGYPSSKLASLTNYQNYCIAMGLLVSPAYITQSPCSSMITDLMTATNSAPVFSSGVLSIVPYGDTTITANGKTYTAPSAPQYDVGDDDYAPQPGDDPVYLDRASNADAYNSVQLECLDRANQYNPAVVGAKDQALIDTYGLRETTISSHWFANLAAGRISAQLQLQKQARRNVYRFTLDHRFVRLDPMDIITLTCKREDGTTWLNREWVRILTIDEDESGNFAMTAEQYDSGTGHAPLHTFQSGVGFNANYNSDPGNANTPVIFEPPVQIAQTGNLEVDIAASGGANWGGCDVYVSSDGNTYKNAGRITGKSRQGVLNGSFASGSDPDTSHTLHVDLTLSSGSLTSGTQADADGNHTLCYVDGEYISFQTATLTSTYHYDLTTYLRRGQFGSTISAHNSGTQFARMDGGIFAVPFDKSKIGTTLYIKLVSFNIYGGGLQSVANVTPYTHLLAGPPIPAQVANFQAQQQGNVVAFNWTDNVSNVGLKGYDLAYGAVGTTWAQKAQLTEASRSTEMTNASVPPGTWEFSIRAHDIADNLGPESKVTLTVVNTNPTISSVAQEPGWPGTVSGFYIHYTGVLTPLGTKTVGQYTALSPPTAPTLGTVAGGTIALTTYYAKITYVDAGGESLPSAESSQLVLVNNLLTCASPATSGLATGWNLYLSTSAGTETLQNSTPIAIGTNWTEPLTGLVSGAALPTVNTTGWQVFNQFVPDPVASAYYIAPTIDTGYDDVLRVYSTIGYGLGYGQSGNPTMTYEIDTWLTAGADTGVFTPWIIGSLNMRYIRSELYYGGITAGSVAYVTDFTPTVDAEPTIEDFITTVSPGGSTVTFPAQYHAAPYVKANAISGTALYAEATSITATNCVINVYNNSGTSVGGTVSVETTGE